MQIRFNLASLQTAFIINYVTLIMGQDAPKRRFLSLIFLVSCISKSFLIYLLTFSKQDFPNKIQLNLDNYFLLFQVIIKCLCLVTVEVELKCLHVLY